VVKLLRISMLQSWALFFIFCLSRLLVLRSQSLISHSFPHVPLGLPPSHLTSHLMSHLTILQSIITCHHSAVRSTPQHHHLTHYGLPAHDALSIDCQLMIGAILRLPAHCQLIMNLTICDRNPCDPLLPTCI